MDAWVYTHEIEGRRPGREYASAASGSPWIAKAKQKQKRRCVPGDRNSGRRDVVLAARFSLKRYQFSFKREERDAFHFFRIGSWLCFLWLHARLQASWQTVHPHRISCLIAGARAKLTHRPLETNTLRAALLRPRRVNFLRLAPFIYIHW